MCGLLECGELLAHEQRGSPNTAGAFAEAVLKIRENMNVEQIGERLAALNQERAEMMRLLQAARGADWDIDRIIYCDDRDRAWIRDNNLWPSSWGIPPEEITAIRAGRLLLGFLFSPSAVVKFPPPDLFGPEQVPFVFVDVTLMMHPDAEVRLSRDELISIILHEFGHFLNPVAGAPDREHVADDYARHLQRGEQLASALNKLRASGRSGFDNAGIEGRIQRIRNAEEPVLCERLQRQRR